MLLLITCVYVWCVLYACMLVCVPSQHTRSATASTVGNARSPDARPSARAAVQTSVSTPALAVGVPAAGSTSGVHRSPVAGSAARRAVLRVGPGGIFTFHMDHRPVSSPAPGPGASGVDTVTAGSAGAGTEASEGRHVVRRYHDHARHPRDHHPHQHRGSSASSSSSGSGSSGHTAVIASSAHAADQSSSPAAAANPGVGLDELLEAMRSLGPHDTITAAGAGAGAASIQQAQPRRSVVSLRVRNSISGQRDGPASDVSGAGTGGGGGGGEPEHDVDSDRSSSDGSGDSSDDHHTISVSRASLSFSAHRPVDRRASTGQAPPAQQPRGDPRRHSVDDDEAFARRLQGIGCVTWCMWCVTID